MAESHLSTICCTILTIIEVHKWTEYSALSFILLIITKELMNRKAKYFLYFLKGKKGKNLQYFNNCQYSVKIWTMYYKREYITKKKFVTRHSIFPETHFWSYICLDLFLKVDLSCISEESNTSLQEYCPDVHYADMHNTCAHNTYCAIARQIIPLQWG